MIYQWKTGFRSNGVNPGEVAQQLEQIRAANSTLTTKLIVEDSRRENAPLHEYFEWNDTEAAYHYRLGQAAQVLSALVVVAEDHDMPLPVHRAYVRVASIDESEEDIVTGELSRIKRSSRFERIDIALSDDNLRRRVLEAAWRELESWRQKYVDYQELARVVAAIDREREKAGRLAA